MRRLIIQMQKEWSEFRRDRLSISLAVLLPLITLLLFAFGVRMQSHDIEVLVVDKSNSVLSRYFVEKLEASNTLCVHKTSTDSIESAEAQIASGRVKAAVLIPSDFEDQIMTQKQSKMQCLIDGTDIIDARLIDASIKGACKYFLLTSGLEKLPFQVETNMRIWFNPGLKEALFIVPGVFGIVLWMFPSLLACVATAREKEQGTVLQVFVSDLRAHELVLGKAILYFLVGLAQAALIVSLACFLFDLKLLGGGVLFLIALPVFIFSSVLFGIMLGSLADSQTSAVQAVSSLGFFTCLLLSGFVYPINNIPFPLSLLSYLVPARYLIEVSRNAFERGLYSGDVIYNPLILLLFCLCFFLVSCQAWQRLRKEKA